MTPIRGAEIITERGATPIQILEYLMNKGKTLEKYKVILIHVGTNWLNSKPEWQLHKRLIRNQISKEQYDKAILDLNPPPAVGPPEEFQKTFYDIIGCIRGINQDATILISAIIPRNWDYSRRNPVRISYNAILKKLNKEEKVFYIPTFRSFFDNTWQIRQHLFARDGLHLTNEGLSMLQTFFCDRIHLALNQILK